MKLKFSKFIRVLTVAPVMAAILLVTIFSTHGAEMGGVKQFLAGIVFLSLLPILAYPLQPLIPGFRDKGREGQRNLAMIFAVLGYLLGIVFGLLTHAPAMTLALYLTYLFSGAAILLFNKAFGMRISGHACGVCGPIAFMAYYVHPLIIIPGLLLLFSVFDASLRMKRHTIPQFLGGAVTPVVSFFISVLIASAVI